MFVCLFACFFALVSEVKSTENRPRSDVEGLPEDLIDGANNMRHCHKIDLVIQFVYNFKFKCFQSLVCLYLFAHLFCCQAMMRISELLASVKQ